MIIRKLFEANAILRSRWAHTAVVACTSPANKQGLQQRLVGTVATAQPRKQDEKEGIIRKKATEQPPSTYFSRDELAEATYPAGLPLRLLFCKVVRGQEKETP